MNITGIGILFSGGRGVEAFRQRLRAGWQAPEQGMNAPRFGVDLERVPDKAVLKKLRRSDKLSKMAVLAAADAVADGGISEEERRRLGVIVATAFGAHATTFEFLDGILDYGEAAVSPTVFSNSVHNAAASYVSSALGIQGPTLTVTQFFFSFHAALQLADAWLAEGRVGQVLVGAVDQLGAVMEQVYAERLSVAADGRVRPFEAGRPAAVPGEGAVFLLLERAGRSPYCSAAMAQGGGAAPADRPDLQILDADGLLPDGPAYLRGLVAGVPAAAYAPLYGSMMTGSALSAAAAAIMLREQRLYPGPFPDDVPGVPFLREPADSSVEFIRCIRYNCHGDNAEIHFRKA